jgi:hypothetical protein
MAMPKPVFKTHVAANKYKKWNILREIYSEVKRIQDDKYF